MTTIPGGLDGAADAVTSQRPSAMLLVTLPALRPKTIHDSDV